MFLCYYGDLYPLLLIFLMARHHTDFHHSNVYWVGFRDRITDVPGENICNLGASAAVAIFGWVQARIDVCITY